MEQALTVLAGLIIAALFRYVPKLNTWFAAQSDEVKRLIVLGVIVISAVITYLAGCSGVKLPFIEPVACDATGGKVLFEAVVMLILGSQAGSGILPKLKDAKAAELAGDLKRAPEEKKLAQERITEEKKDDTKKE